MADVSSVGVKALLFVVILIAEIRSKYLPICLGCESSCSTMCPGLNRLLKRSAKCGLFIAVQANLTSPIFDGLKAWGFTLNISRSRAVDSQTDPRHSRVLDGTVFGGRIRSRMPAVTHWLHLSLFDG